MKHIILLLFLSTSIFSQENFIWDQIDTIPGTKSELYSKTKSFIAYYWRDAKHVIQNDDKEGGIIIVKGSIDKTLNILWDEAVYIYNYTFTFMLKDGRYRIKAADVYCDRSYIRGKSVDIRCIPPFEGENHLKGTMFEAAPKKKSQQRMMEEIKVHIGAIVAAYMIHMRSKNEIAEDW